MPVMAEYAAPPTDVGELLIRVQEDLHHLKEKINLHKDEGRQLDIFQLEEAINKTEQEIKHKSEQLASQINNRVNTLPSLEAQAVSFGDAETTWDHREQQNDYQIRPIGQIDYRTLQRKPLLQNRQKMQMAGPTPAQMSKSNFNMKVVSNPYNPQNRQFMNDAYGVQLPVIVDRRQNKQPPKPVTGSTVDHLAVLPRANRVDPQLMPPPITESDAKKGILSLMERGLIPPAAEVKLDPSPVRHRMVLLHDPSERSRSPPAPPAINDAGYNLAAVKLDTAVKSTESVSSIARRGQISHSAKRREQKSILPGDRSDSKTPATMRQFDIPLQPLPPPTTPATEYKTHSHKFAIQHGRIRENSPEFVAFKQHYCLSWGNIVTMLTHVKKLLSNYAIPIAFVYGDKLADLSQIYELDKAPTTEDLLSVIVNREDVQSLMFRPGRKFLGPQGQDYAATVIQSSYRRYRDRTWYLEYRARKWAAGVIAISWVMNVKLSNVRKQLKQIRLDNLEGFRRRSKELASSWDRMKKSRRVIIHLPSLGYSLKIRETIPELAIKQNTQMSRIADLRDPNVDVIYISPVAMNDETMQYYGKLFGLQEAISSGNVDDQQSIDERFKIIVPEAIQSFPAHHMPLSSILKYSPKAMIRIKNLVRGRNAYIVPGMPNKDDLAVADILGVPLMCPEPEVAHLYSTKSGCKRIFASANVECPPGEYDIYSLQQLHECLAQLVTENLNITRWLLKLDDEFDGRGIAYCDVTKHLKCYNWAVKESQRYGEKWSKKWAQEPAYMRILSEIPEVLAKHGTPTQTEVYPTWAMFIEAFLSQGGIVEACPPSESVTTLRVDMLIEPNGLINMVSMGDQLHAENEFQCWGVSVPQSSVEPDILNRMCSKISEACKTRGVIGYFSIDFVTFIDPNDLEQKVWALDLNLMYSDSTALTQMVHFITQGSFDTKNHMFNAQVPKKEKKKVRRRRYGVKKVEEEEEEEEAPTQRYSVLSTRLRHSNLAVVHYSVFFQMCRAHGIGYDIKEKQGTVFQLIDCFNRENIGMITVGDNLQGALATFARNLSVIHQEVSSPNMPGETNFKAVIEDIEGIIGTTVENAEGESDDEDDQT